MKLIHTSDWHLGRYLHDYSLHECQEYFISWFIDFLKKDKYDAVVIAGDIFDRSVPPAEAVILFGRFLAEFSRLDGISLFIIPGNHDSADRLSYCAEILQNSRIYISGTDDDCSKPVTLPSGEINYDFYLLPFISENSFEDVDSDSGFMKTIAGIEKTLRKDSINILVGHAFAAGAVTSDSERIYVGGLASVGHSAFRSFDYTAMGHLHRGQKITENAFYSGSPLKYSFSEAGDDKHLISVDFTDGKAVCTKIPVPQKHEMKRVAGRFESLLADAVFNDLQECFLEIELTDDGIIESPVSVLKNRFPLLLSVRQNLKKTGESGDDIGEFSENRGPLEYLQDFYSYVADRKPDERELDLFRETTGDIYK